MLRKLIRQTRNSTTYSLQGLGFMLRSEFAARIEVYAFIWVMAGLLLLGTPLIYLVSATILFLALLAIEAVNTAIEVIIDRVSPEISPTGKRAKDLGSFAVMCLLGANLLHLLFVLSRVDWRDLEAFQSGGPGFALLSLAALGFSISAFTTPEPRPIAKWVLAGLTTVFVTGLAVRAAALPIFTLFFAIFLLLGLCAGAFVFDLLGARKSGLAKAVIRFLHRRTRVGQDAVEMDSPAGSRRNAIVFGSATLFVALVLHPLTAALSAWV